MYKTTKIRIRNWGDFRMKLFGQTIHTLERALNYSALRNETISNNIANVDTPNYKSKDVVFKDMLHDAMKNNLQAKRTNERHLPFTSANDAFQVITRKNTAYSHNGNNVDIDKEMSNSAQNQIYYRSMVDRLNGKFNTLQTVIRGGR